MDLFKVLNFIAWTPFTQNWVFPILIIGIFFASIWLNYKNNNERFNYYKNNIDNLIFDDYQNGKSFSAIPGILMSVGIIGTFYLIYESLGDINEKTNMITLIGNHIAPCFFYISIWNCYLYFICYY